MNTAQDDTTAAVPARRSRWQRFSPSMGWRAFWSEIVIVVLGVVIALAANETVQDWSWRSKVKDGEARLREDTALIFARSAERYATAPCVDAQLEALIGRVMDSGERLDPAPIHAIYNQQLVLVSPLRSFRFPTWDALVADGTAIHMSRERQAMYSRLGDSMSSMRLSMEEFMRLRARLLVLGHPIVLDVVTRNQLLTDLEALRAMNAADARSLGQEMHLIAQQDLAPSADRVEQLLATGVGKFCREQGLPLADWRDVSSTLVGSGSSASTSSDAVAPK